MLNNEQCLTQKYLCIRLVVIVTTILTLLFDTNIFAFGSCYKGCGVAGNFSSYSFCKATKALGINGQGLLINFKHALL